MAGTNYNNTSRVTHKRNQPNKSEKATKLVVGKVFSYLMNIILTILLIMLLTGTIIGIVFVKYVKDNIDSDMSDFISLTTAQDMTTRVYYMDYTDRYNRIGTPIEIENQKLFSSENRVWVSYNDIPENLINAFVSIEDERFWEHNGVDWKRTLGAAKTFIDGSQHFGGSTITQQLIKNITQDNEITIQRKIQEILRALELERIVDKEDIIEMYLNTIYLSEHCYGIQSAAKAYFNKDVKDLSLVECAALASIPKYPTKFDPFIHPDNNKERRDIVLRKMYELDKIATKEEYEAAKAVETLDLNDNIETETTVATTSWYTDAVIDECTQLLMDNLNLQSETLANQMVYTGGLKIYTVMDPEVQSIMEQYFLDDDNFSRINRGVQPECSMVVIDPQTGDILGIAGGRGEKTQSRVLNYATQTTRSPGSSIKPVTVYGPALEKGVITYSSVYNDAPVTKLRGRNWPVNYPAGYKGATTVHDAIRRSVNTIAVRVLQDLGIENSYEYGHDTLGMTSIIDKITLSNGRTITDKDLSPLALGGMNYGLTVRELTSAYQIFANKGIYNGSRTVIKILDSQGNVIVDNDCLGRIAMSEGNATIMTIMLEDVVKSGTGSKANIKNKIDVAGKTGTTSDDNDRWFVGYTPYYLGGCWFGYAMPKSLQGFSETASPALMVWNDVMKLLHQKYFDAAANGEGELAEFEYSNDIVRCWVCHNSGLKMSKRCSGGEYGYFTSESVPTKYCPHNNTFYNSGSSSKDGSDKDSSDKDKTSDTSSGTSTTKNGETSASGTSTQTRTDTNSVTGDTVPTDTEQPTVHTETEPTEQPTDQIYTPEPTVITSPTEPVTDPVTEPPATDPE